MLEDPDPRLDEELEEELPETSETPEPEVEEEEPVDEPVDDEPELNDEPVQVQPKGKSKDENMAALRRAEQTARERADKAERELAEARRPQPRQEDPQAEARRLQAMTPEQRIQHFAAVAEERITRATAVGQFQAADQADRASFAVRTASDPRVAKYAQEVETRLHQLRQGGANASREDMLRYIIGERVMANAPKVKKQQAAAKETIRQQTTNPERPKGDTGGKRRVDEKTARAKRLDGVRL